MGKKKIGILTGGGDCPGLNAVIRGATKCAINRYGWEVVGFCDGFLGLIEGRFVNLTHESVSGILARGGTILGSSNKANPFEHPIEENGRLVKIDVSDKCMELYRDLGLEALICAGGDGTMTIASALTKKGAQIIGVPKTIDKDVMETDITFGFDSARRVITEAIDSLHTTADSHHRVMFVEVMGRNAGWLALEGGIAGGGDIIVLPEIPYDISEITSAIRKRSRYGKRFSIVVVAEGALPVGGKQTVSKIVEDSPDPVRLGGIGELVASQVEKETKIECRVTVLGHLQRGGTPSPYDRVLATELSAKAVDFVAAGEFNCMVAVQSNELVPVPIEKVMGRQKTVPLNHQLIDVALAMGMSFGADVEKLRHVK